MANQGFDSIAEVEELIEQRCCHLLRRPDWLRGITFYHWWPQVMSKDTYIMVN
uniref:hypothetical protein n=1 Tax=Trichodesmium erythraeum TaxID=1206 RepID=UPI00003C9D4B